MIPRPFISFQPVRSKWNTANLWRGQHLASEILHHGDIVLQNDLFRRLAFDVINVGNKLTSEALQSTHSRTYSASKSPPLPNSFFSAFFAGTCCDASTKAEDFIEFLIEKVKLLQFAASKRSWSRYLTIYQHHIYADGDGFTWRVNPLVQAFSGDLESIAARHLDKVRYIQGHAIELTFH